MQHGHCNGWRLLEGDEGCTDPHEIMLSYFPQAPADVMYSNPFSLPGTTTPLSQVL